MEAECQDGRLHDAAFPRPDGGHSKLDFRSGKHDPPAPITQPLSQPNPAELAGIHNPNPFSGTRRAGESSPHPGPSGPLRAR